MSNSFGLLWSKTYIAREPLTKNHMESGVVGKLANEAGNTIYTPPHTMRSYHEEFQPAGLWGPLKTTQRLQQSILSHNLIGWHVDQLAEYWKSTGCSVKSTNFWYENRVENASRLVCWQRNWLATMVDMSILGGKVNLTLEPVKSTGRHVGQTSWINTSIENAINLASQLIYICWKVDLPLVISWLHKLVLKVDLTCLERWLTNTIDQFQWLVSKLLTLIHEDRSPQYINQSCWLFMLDQNLNRVKCLVPFNCHRARCDMV